VEACVKNTKPFLSSSEPYWTAAIPDRPLPPQPKDTAPPKLPSPTVVQFKSIPSDALPELVIP